MERGNFARFDRALGAHDVMRKALGFGIGVGGTRNGEKHRGECQQPPVPHAFSPHGTSTTLPALPERRSAMASSNSCIGITCVIAGRMSSFPDPSRLSIWYQVSYMR